MDPATLNWASLGVGGILAGVMWWTSREDRKDLREMQKTTTTALIANTAALEKLSGLIDRRGERGATS